MSIELSTLAKIIEANEGIKVTETEDGLLISEVNEGQTVPADLVNFVKIYEKESNIVPSGSGYEITTDTFSGQTFMMLLKSVYGAEYDIEVTGEYKVKVTPKSKEGVREEFNEGMTAEQISDRKADMLADLDKELDKKWDGCDHKYDKEDAPACKEKLKDYEKKEKAKIAKWVEIMRDKNKGESFEVNFKALAEAIDSEDIDIEIHEDGLKVMAINKMDIAEKLDELNPTLNIEITKDFILVSEGV